MKNKNKKISKSLKHYHKHKRVMKEVKTILWAILILTIVCQFRPAGVIAEEEFTKNYSLPVAEDKTELKDKVIAEIIKQARLHGINETEALSIAYCESLHNPNAKNWQGSSATGIYMFIDKTWANYCKGDRTDYEDNIKCFAELYPKFPQWWECYNILYGSKS
jgi:hypothetical protein